MGSDDQPGRVEIGLREDELLKKSGRGRLHSPALRRLIAPDFRQSRWVRIAKGTECVHSGSRIVRRSSSVRLASYAEFRQGDKESARQLRTRFMSRRLRRHI